MNIVFNVLNVIRLSDMLFSLSRISRELTPQKQLKEEAELVIEQLMISVHYTAVSFILRVTEY